MTFDLAGFKSNMAELCSAAKTGELVPSITGSSVYNANRGLGIVYRGFYTLCSFTGREPPVKPLLKEALTHAKEEYGKAAKIAGDWLAAKKAGKESRTADSDVVLFLTSFHRTCRDNHLLKGLQALFQAQDIQFNLAVLPNIEFYRRLDCFERATQTPFPLALVKEAIEKKAPDSLKRQFEEYESRVLDSPLPFLPEVEKEGRRGRLVDKLVKIIKELGAYLQVESQEAYAIWGKMGCSRLLGYVSEKRKRRLEALERFPFGDATYDRQGKVSYDFSRLWTAIPITDDLEVIVFHSVLAGAFLSKEREGKAIIPINKTEGQNFDMGLILKEGHAQSWADSPLGDYEEELIELVQTLMPYSRLPVEAPHNLMEPASYGFNESGKLTVKLNYVDAPYHPYILHDFLFKAVKKSPGDYIRLFKVCGLNTAPMAKEIGKAVIGYLMQDEKEVKLAANAADASEDNFEPFWVIPFKNAARFGKEECGQVIDNYMSLANGAYPFDGVLEFLLEA